MDTRKCVKIILWITLFEAIGFILGKITDVNLPWYAELSKSTLTPPGFVFSIVWSILYAILAIVGWFFWENRHNPRIKPYSIIYFLQLLINWAWTPVFFQLHFLDLGFLLIVSMVILNGIIILGVRNEKPQAALALTPYFLWLVFASYLSGMIWILN